ncbi:MAG: DNA polymerase I, partial [Bacteroidales bacterium]|nr:DNA polymerase I [Bacteroidales bacterium]
MTGNKKLFLLDAYALIFRAYYAFIHNPVKTSQGLNTSAIYGFINTLNDIIKNQNPSHIAVVFDPPSPTFRHKMYKEYKANREATPEDIRKSVPYIKKIISAYNIPILEVEGYEADDTIGTIAKKAESKGFKVYMMTSDKDFAQLVSDNIFIYKPGRGGTQAVIWNKEKVREEFMVESPEQVIEVLALWGDASDNIPGAPGIGEKTSKKLISKYGGIDEIFKNIEHFKGKQKESLIKYREQIELSRKLVEIPLDVPVDFDEEAMKSKDPDKDKLQEIFQELEFKSFLFRLNKGIEMPAKKEEIAAQGSLFYGPDTGIDKTDNLRKNIKSTPHNYILVDTPEKQDALISKLNKQNRFCFDTETTGLDTVKDELVGISFCCESHEACWLPVESDKKISEKVLEKFKPVFENEKIEKIGQNLKFDIKVMRKRGIVVKGALFDTMIAHYLIKPEGRHGLNDLAEDYLNYTPVKIEELIGVKGKNQANMRSVPQEKIKEYAAEDADLTWQIKEILEKELKEKHLETLARKIEMPLIYVLCDMEMKGFKVNVDVLKKYSAILKIELLDIQNKIYKLADTEFNISSPKQLGEILFNKMKIDSKAKKTKTGQYSTSEEVLQRLVNRHEIVSKILEFRSISKLLSTYVEKLPELKNSETGKIHSSFNQTITATGRLSSNNPNLQNIPIREDRGREIRKAFIPSDVKHVLISADYSQIELRLMAHMSGDKNMIEAFNAGEDIHVSTAAKIHRISSGDVTKEMRGRAKTANFGIIYGISAFGLSRRMNLSLSDAKEFIEEYFKTYPGVKKYMDESIEGAREKGYVQTIMGRTRYLPDILSRNSVVRGFAERNAINAPIQGSAADIIKIAMINIHNRIEEKQLKSGMILQVHDELVFDVPEKEVDELSDIVVNEMQNAVKLDVPLIVEWGTGRNWLEA